MVTWVHTYVENHQIAHFAVFKFKIIVIINIGLKGLSPNPSSTTSQLGDFGYMTQSLSSVIIYKQGGYHLFITYWPKTSTRVGATENVLHRE